MYVMNEVILDISVEFKIKKLLNEIDIEEIMFCQAWLPDRCYRYHFITLLQDHGVKSLVV